MNRQWWMVVTVLVAIGLLIGVGSFAREQFAPVEVGSVAPEFQATDLQGNPVQLSDLQGEVVLLNIWATWCPPCLEEMPSMQRLHEELAAEGLQIVAVSIDAPIGLVDRGGNLGGDIDQFVKRMGLTFTIWHDPAGEIQRVYRTTGVPESFVIDRRGYIVKKVIGQTDWSSEANVALITRLLQG